MIPENLHGGLQRIIEVRRVFYFMSNMLEIKNLLLVAGTGTKSGKTSFICRVITEFQTIGIVAIKITPHFHETTDGLILISEGAGYAIYRETNGESFKDTSRMLNAGASTVYFAKVWDDQLSEVFNKIMKLIPAGTPVICESPALRNFAVPGVFVIMNSGIINKKKDISYLQKLPHVMFELEEIDKTDSLPLGFGKGRWFYK